MSRFFKPHNGKKFPQASLKIPLLKTFKKATLEKKRG